MNPENSFEPLPRRSKASLLMFRGLLQRVSGPAVLILRQGAVQAIGLAGGIVLARTVTQEEYGIYGICSFLFYFIVAFGDLGFGAALIRAETAPGKNELRSLLALRQAVDLLVCSAVVIAAPTLARAWTDDPDAVSTIRMVAAAAAIFSFQIVPTVALERQLRFGRLAAVEIAQTAAFMSTAVYGVFEGYGLLSFGAAWIAHALTGALLAFFAYPWSFGWSTPAPIVHPHWRFALPYQANGFVYLIRDGLAPIFLGMLLGSAEVGRLNWSLMLATFAAAGLLVLQRLYFPLFADAARRADSAGTSSSSDNSPLEKTLSDVLTGVHVVIAPLAVLSLSFSESITALVFGEKWLSAMPLYHVLWFLNLFMPTASVLASFLNALGKSRTVFSYSLLLALMTWILGVPLTEKFGALGCAASLVAAYSSLIFLVVEVRRHTPCHILSSIWRPWALAAVVGGFAAAGRHFIAVDSILMLLFQGSSWTVLYFALAYQFILHRKFLNVAPGARISASNGERSEEVKHIPASGEASHNVSLPAENRRLAK